MKRRRDARRQGRLALWMAGGAMVAAAAGAYLWSTSKEAPDAPVAWARLGTADVHPLAFEATDPDRLLFGHHDGLPGLDLHAFAVDPADPDRAWTFAVGHGFFRTENAGRNWELLDPGNWGALTAYRRDGVTVLAGIGPEGFVRSANGGTSWAPMAYPGAPIAAMTPAPDGSVLYAATAAGIRKSTDEGATWSETGFGIQALALAVLPEDRDVIAAIGSDTMFYRSSDGGASWYAPAS